MACHGCNHSYMHADKLAPFSVTLGEGTSRGVIKSSERLASEAAALAARSKESEKEQEIAPSSVTSEIPVAGESGPASKSE